MAFLLIGGVNLSGQADDHPLPSVPSVRFGQSIAISDLDGDNFFDRAHLAGIGARKSIEVFLSRTGQSSVLEFDTATSEHGSLLARDVNDDGDVDLIWTDLIHPDFVVIWLNQGLGKFIRTSDRAFDHDFVFPGPTGRFSQSAGFQCCAGPASAPDQESSVSSLLVPENVLNSRKTRSVEARSSLGRLLSGRGPPLNFLS